MDYASLKAKAERGWAWLENLPQPLVIIGMGTCGRASGAGEVLAAARKTLKSTRVLARIMEVGCIGMCYAEPLMGVRKPGRPTIYYSGLTPEKTEMILTRYLCQDDPCRRWAEFSCGSGEIDTIPPIERHPMMRPQVRIALRNCGHIDPTNIDHYIARGGYSGLKRALDMPAEAVIKEITDSGLRGRGGAGFPTGTKWSFARRAPGRSKYLICNADEGDPGAFMDRALLEGDPHAVLEGMLIAAYAIGAAEGYIYIRAEYPLAIERLERPSPTCSAAVCWAKRSWAADSSSALTIKQGAGAFVCGEETALMASIEGGGGCPGPGRRSPPSRGLWGKPTTSTTWRPSATSRPFCNGERMVFPVRHRDQQRDQDLLRWPARSDAPA